MVTWFTNLRNLQEGMFFFFSVEKNRCTLHLSYNLNVVRRSVCLVFGPIMIDDYAASIFNCKPVGQAST